MEGNAQIRSTVLGNDDNQCHGILSSFINLQLGSSYQEFGGYSLGNKYLSYWVERILEIAGVSLWEDLVGCYVRVKSNSEGIIYAIGHIIEDKWFDPTKEFKEMQVSDNVDPTD